MINRGRRVKIRTIASLPLHQESFTTQRKNPGEHFKWAMGVVAAWMMGPKAMLTRVRANFMLVNEMLPIFAIVVKGGFNKMIRTSPPFYKLPHIHKILHYAF